MTRRAVITGLGIVSPIGIGAEAFWSAALAGRSGIGRPTLFDASKLPPECQIVGEVRDFDPCDWMSPSLAKTAGRFSQFAVAAAKLALDDSGLDVHGIGRDRIKVAIGTSMNGLTDVFQPNFQAFARGDRIAPSGALEYPPHAAASHIALATEASGQALTISSACAAGIDAIIWAANEVRSGRATAVLAGASDTPLSAVTVSAFQTAGVLSRWRGDPESASRPFDRLRSGLVVSEGSGVVVVEDEDNARSRGARKYARILGFASLSEGGNLRRPVNSGPVTKATFLEAIRQSDVSPADIDYISAHGNSMIEYDAGESAGIREAFGRRAWSIPVSSIKSMCGQPFAAGSAIQIVAACLTLSTQKIHPTANYSVPDPVCDLDYVPNRARSARVRSSLIHAQSMGGLHTAMVLASP